MREQLHVIYCNDLKDDCITGQTQGVPLLASKQSHDATQREQMPQLEWQVLLHVRQAAVEDVPGGNPQTQHASGGNGSILGCDWVPSHTEVQKDGLTCTTIAGFLPKIMNTTGSSIGLGAGSDNLCLPGRTFLSVKMRAPNGQTLGDGARQRCNCRMLQQMDTDLIRTFFAPAKCNHQIKSLTGMCIQAVPHQAACMIPVCQNAFCLSVQLLDC